MTVTGSDAGRRTQTGVLEQPKNINFAELPPALAKLLENPKRLSAIRLWRALEQKERRNALLLLIRRRKNREEFIRIVGDKFKGYRRSYIAKWNDTELVTKVLRLQPPDWLLKSLLYEMHERRRRDMLADFLDALGIPNDDGVVIPGDDGATEPLEGTDPGEAKVYAAAEGLAREHGLGRSVVYFLTLTLQRVPFADHLWNWMESGRDVEGSVDQGLGSGDDEGALLGEHIVVTPAAAEPIPKLSENGEAVSDSAEKPAVEDDERHGIGEDPLATDDEAAASAPEVPAPTITDSPEADSRQVISVGPEIAESPRTAGGARFDAADRSSPRTLDSSVIGAIEHVADPEADELSVATEAATHVDDAARPALRTLDGLLIRAIVDSCQDVQGSLSKDDIVDAVDELISLNSSRHQSYFHAGYRDVLFRRSLARELPAENDTRKRWYWAGAILGWTRRRSWLRIVEAYDANSAVRAIGNEVVDATTDEAARRVVHALWREGRTEEIADFSSVRALTKSALTESRRLLTKVLDIGTDLLYRGDAARADAIFDGLIEAVRRAEMRTPSNGGGEVEAERKRIFLVSCPRDSHT